MGFKVRAWSLNGDHGLLIYRQLLKHWRTKEISNRWSIKWMCSQNNWILWSLSLNSIKHCTFLKNKDKEWSLSQIFLLLQYSSVIYEFISPEKNPMHLYQPWSEVNENLLNSAKNGFASLEYKIRMQLSIYIYDFSRGGGIIELLRAKCKIKGKRWQLSQLTP